MLRPLAVLTIVLLAAPAVAAEMTPTAPQKMTSPSDRQRMEACQKQAADTQVPMEQRAKFVMDCMTAK